MKFFAIDLGSSYTKTSILDTEKLKCSPMRQFRPPFPCLRTATRYEIDPEAYFQHVQSVIDAHLAEDSSICGILFSTQMHGFILTDCNNKPASPLVTWQDEASLEQGNQEKTFLDMLMERLPDYRQLDTGVPLKKNLAMSNLFARTKKQEIDLRGKRFHTLGGFMIARLCGNHVCHVTNAAPSGMFNVRKNDWERSVIQAAGLDALSFPEALSDIVPCGVYPFRDRKISLYPDVGDHQACVLGSQAMPERDLSVNIGTAGLLSRIVQDYTPGDYENRPFFQRMFLRSVSGLPGGRHLDSIAGFFSSFLEEAAPESDPNAVWRFMTRVRPQPRTLYTIDLDAWGRNEGTLNDIGPNMTPSAIIVSIYAEIARRYRSAALRLGGIPKKIVYAGGCILKNPALQKELEASLSLPGATLTGEDAVMRGLLRLAAEVK